MVQLGLRAATLCASLGNWNEQTFAAVRTHVVFFFLCFHIWIVFVELLHVVDHVLTTRISEDFVTRIFRALVPPFHSLSAVLGMCS